MKVLLLSTYGMGGGAGIACRRLQMALQGKGISADILVRTGDNPHQGIYSATHPWIQNAGFLWDKFSEKLRFMGNEKDKSVRFAFSYAYTGVSVVSHPLFQAADVIHIHWIQHGFLSLSNLQEIAQSGKPVVWTLHDEWVFTGGCHYAGGCRRFEQKCGYCPMLKHPSANDWSNRLWHKKRNLYLSFPQLQFVTCSQWLKHEALSSQLLDGMQVSSIPNPIDLSEYYDIGKNEARHYWGIEASRFVLLFVAQRVNDPRKGYTYLKRALKQLPEHVKQATTLLVMGKSEPGDFDDLEVEVKLTGSVSGIEGVRTVYSASDVLVTPSMEDNLPNTIMEAMACSRAVVAFKTGGIPEMIAHQETGWLSDTGYEQGLTEGIAWLYEQKDTNVAGLAARIRAEALYSPRIVAEQYLKIYTSFLNS
jgi:glycosyltransferase involved in cell wall biosynthesis